MAELKNIRIAVSGIYDYAFEELPSLQIALPGQGAPEWVEKKRVYKVYRPALVLAAACDKFKMLPLTHHHPNEAVDEQNFQKLIIGYTGSEPFVDYLENRNEVGICSTVMLGDKEALDAYNRGEVQLSPGYYADFEWSKGTSPDGQEYDIIMKKINDVNHLALLPCGRGGSDAVVLDNAPKTKELSIFEIVKQTQDGAPIGNDNASKNHENSNKTNVSEEIEDRTENIIKKLQADIVDFPEVEFNETNYKKYLGTPIETPLGKVKMGEHQFEKLKTNRRTHLIGAIAETLKKPGYMCRDTDGKIIFIKTFKRKENPHNVVTVLIERDGLKITISAHDKRDNQIRDIITRADPIKEVSPDHGTVHDCVADTTCVASLIIQDEEHKIKSIFEIVKEK